MGSAESKVAAQPPPLAVVATAGGHQSHNQSQSTGHGRPVVLCNFLRKQNKTAPAIAAGGLAQATPLSSPTIEAVKEAQKPSSPSAASTSISSMGAIGPTAQLLATNKVLGLHQLNFEELSTQLLKAVKNGDLKLVESITEICATKQLPSIINIRGMWESTPLIYACQYCHEPIALWLLQAGADAQLVNEKGVTALLLASLEGMAVAVQQMLATRGSGDGNGGAPLAIDAQVGVVYNSMTDVNVRASPLLAASMNGHVEIVRMLLQHGAKVNSGVSCNSAKPAPSESGGGGGRRGGGAGGRGALQFPFLVAAKYGHSAVAQLLIQHGADIGVSDGTENHALLLACESAKEDCALALLQQLPLAEHDTWKRSNCHGFTALHYCAVHGLVQAAEWMVRQLQWKDDLAFLNATSSTRHESAVLIASRKKQVSMVKLLLQCGANATLADRGGTTPLDVLKREKRDELVALWQELQLRQQHEQRIQKDSTQETVEDDQATTPAREMPRCDAMAATDGDTSIVVDEIPKVDASGNPTELPTAVVAITTTTTTPLHDTQHTSDQTVDSPAVVPVVSVSGAEDAEISVPVSVSPSASSRTEREKHKKKKRHSRKKVAETDGWNTSELSVSSGPSAPSPTADSTVQVQSSIENNHDTDGHQQTANSNEGHDQKGDLDDDF